MDKEDFMYEPLNNLIAFISKDVFINLMTLVISGANIYIAYKVYQFTKKDINPKLYVDSKMIDPNDSMRTYSSSTINDELIDINFDKQGFPEIQHDTMLWQLIIANNGDLAATDVVVKYSIIIKKATFEFDSNKIEMTNEEFVDFKTLNRTIEIDYIPPNSEKNKNILYLRGDFPSAELEINTIKSSELEFIIEPFHLDNYKHPDFNMLADPDHARKMYGVYKDK